MDVWRMQACEAIRSTIATYNWCGDNGDMDGFVATFAPQGVLEIKGRSRHEGHDAIRHAATNSFGNPPEQIERIRAAGRFSHHVSSLRIEVVSAELAHCWSYFMVMGRGGADHWGRYTDTLVPLQGRWLFASRRVSIDAAHPASVMFPA